MPGALGTYPGRADDLTQLPVLPAPIVAPAVTSAQTTASAAAAVIADTGPLAAGVYKLEVSLGFSGVLAAGKHISIEHRNAANGGNVNVLGLCPAGQIDNFTVERIVVAATERIRAVIGAVAAAVSEVASVTIRLYLLPQ